MEIFSMEFFLALLAIIAIDLALAGDNAIVIGLAARNLPAHQQKKVIIWGTVGAIIIRIVATLVVVELLKITGLKLFGGLFLLWIAYKLLVDSKDHGANIKAKGSIMKAIGTILLADLAMGLDNVLAVAGAADGSMLLVIFGLLLSVPIMIFGSTLVIRVIERYPVALYIASGVLAWTAGKMILGEAFIKTFLEEQHSLLKWVLVALITVIILLAGRWVNQRRKLKETGPERLSEIS